MSRGFGLREYCMLLERLSKAEKGITSQIQMIKSKFYASDCELVDLLVLKESKVKCIKKVKCD